MKKYPRFFISLMFCLVFFPVLCAAKTDAVSSPQATLEKSPSNGDFTIFVQKGGLWEKVGTLSYDRHFTEKTLTLGRHINAPGKVGVKIGQHGGGTAHIDSVFLGGKPPVEVKSVDNGLLKLSKKDFDVIDAFDKSIELVFDAEAENNTLSLTARVESTIISKVPFQFPTGNTYRNLDSRSSFYSYRLNSEQGGMQLDGTIEETAQRKPFFKEFSKTGSGHPSGYTYGWVWNDDKNLYVAMDFTPDNTMDSDKDYAKVYANVDGKIKEFKVSVPEQKWGIAGFTYTGNAGYQHKTYEFILPLSEIFSGDIEQNKEIQMAFAAYGTATPSCPTQASITYTCPFTTTAPTIDGAASSAEWPVTAQKFNIASPINAYFYCMVDRANLYILVDAVGDTSTSTDHDTCDECLITFWQGGATTKYVGEIYTDTGATIVDQMPAGGSGVIGFGTSQNSVTSHRIYEWKFPLSSINTAPGGSVFFSSPAALKATCGFGASMPFDGTTNYDNVWPPCLNYYSDDTDTWGILQFQPPDEDGDGVSDDVEDAAPNNGDGNGDGTPDKYQRDVTSLPSATGSGYLTLQIEPFRKISGSLKKRATDDGVTGDCQNAKVQALTEASQAQQDGGFSFPDGLLSFQVSKCFDTDGSVLVTVYYHGATNLSSFTYRKYGPYPTPAGGVQWYTMPGVTFGTATVGAATVPTASFTITDNSTGDDAVETSLIVDQGGPGQPDVATPTMTEWGMIIFAVLAGLGSVYFLRRQKRIAD
ncbi:MAG TPA: choice-of-anchor U domain-containing protein [Thermodesulfovibrionales bacterium]|nr:choice-of-anchor U domain-containing protein [Thermodesulfovibrionales bacterium]